MTADEGKLSKIPTKITYARTTHFTLRTTHIRTNAQTQTHSHRHSHTYTHSRSEIYTNRDRRTQHRFIMHTHSDKIAISSILNLSPQHLFPSFFQNSPFNYTKKTDICLILRNFIENYSIPSLSIIHSLLSPTVNLNRTYL
jgi:hypothetical protein